MWEWKYVSTVVQGHLHTPPPSQRHSNIVADTQVSFLKYGSLSIYAIHPLHSEMLSELYVAWYTTAHLQLNVLLRNVCVSAGAPGVRFTQPTTYVTKQHTVCEPNYTEKVRIQVTISTAENYRISTTCIVGGGRGGAGRVRGE